MSRLFKKTTSVKKSLFLNEKKQGMPKFHTLRISDIIRETEHCMSIAFEIPTELEKDYRFIPGQYLTLEMEIEGEKVRRNYSLCSSPLDDELRVAIKKVEKGKFSSWASEKLKVGTEIEVMTPEGNFHTELNSNQKKDYVAFAAGSGITPIYSIMKSVLEVELKSTFTLFYGNKTSYSIIFRNKIDGLKNKYMNRLGVHHILSCEDQGTDYLKGRIDEVKCICFSEFFFDANEVDEFLLCGPEPMMNCVSDTLQKIGVHKSKIHCELFTSPTQSTVHKVKATFDKKDGEIMSDVTVILDGEETHFTISSDGDSVLDGALNADVDVPYACKGAVCCTCRAKVLEGSVEMKMNYALKDDEVKDGYILTCQSHPTSKRLIVSYDE